MTELVRLFDGDQHIATITRQEARYLCNESKQAYFINHGKDAKVIREVEDTTSELEKFAGWKIAKHFQNSALNRGRSGQFTIGYPIPYAYEGHLTDPKASIVNAVPGNHLDNS